MLSLKYWLTLTGDDWNYGDQDGGIGSVGVVLNVNANGLIIVRLFCIVNKTEHNIARYSMNIAKQFFKIFLIIGI